MYDVIHFIYTSLYFEGVFSFKAQSVEKIMMMMKGPCPLGSRDPTLTKIMGYSMGRN